MSEFDDLLDASSVGPIRPTRRAVQCGPCFDDRCGEISCTDPECTCVCTAEKEVLTEQIRETVDRLGMSYSVDDLEEITDALYREGWRRE